MFATAASAAGLCPSANTQAWEKRAAAPRRAEYPTTKPHIWQLLLSQSSSHPVPVLLGALRSLWVCAESIAG